MEYFLLATIASYVTICFGLPSFWIVDNEPIENFESEPMQRE